VDQTPVSYGGSATLLICINGAAAIVPRLKVTG